MKRSVGPSKNLLEMVGVSFARAKQARKLPEDFEATDANMLGFLTVQTLENLGHDFAEIPMPLVKVMETGIRAAYEVGYNSKERANQ